MTNSVKMKGHWVLSGGDLICIYSIAQKMAYMWGWCESLITDVEWITYKEMQHYIVGQVSGNICLNVFSDQQQLGQLRKVSNKKSMDTLRGTYNMFSGQFLCIITHRSSQKYSMKSG